MPQIPTVSGVDDDDRRSRQWPSTVLTATGLLVTAVATTYVIKTGAAASLDSAEPSAPRTVVATIGPSTPKAEPQAVTATAGPERAVRLPAPAPAGQNQTDLRQVTYTVAGNQRPDDPVTIVYADETGTLQRLDGITLPWTTTITAVLPVNYVTASSRGSQLNCWITDAAGATVVSQTEFSPSTTCNR